MNQPCRLPERPDIPEPLRRQLRQDFERFARQGLPDRLEDYLLDQYRLDVSSTYAGLPIRNPWGKASGQLSMTLRQVEEDVAAGLGFVVLKTVIAQDEKGDQSMSAWAVPESRMVVERITGTNLYAGSETPPTGWTVSWKGRGWWQPFADYLTLVRNAAALGREANVLIAPSCKFHLPGPSEEEWRRGEYDYTTRQLLDAYLPPPPLPGGGEEGVRPMPLEKDFSPTLAGSDRSRQKEQILEWLTVVPRLIREAARGRAIRVGMKLFNSLFEDAFQIEMLRTVVLASPDFIIYGNRLFDPDRVFEGHRGIAYGGPDLSDRNLRVLDEFRRVGGTLLSRAADSGAGVLRPPDWSGTGNIHSGRMAAEYALRGCTSFQMHTLFQLPADVYALRAGSKTQKALHRLYFHPEDGFIAWMHHLAKEMPLSDDQGVVHFSWLKSCSATDT